MSMLNVNISEKIRRQPEQPAPVIALAAEQLELQGLSRDSIALVAPSASVKPRGEWKTSAQIDRAAKVIKSIKRINTVDSREALLQSLQSIAKPSVLSFVNAHALNLAWDHAAFAGSLYHSDIILRDGVGIAVMMKALGQDAGFNMNGTDLIPEILQRYAGKRVAICGTTEPYLTQAAEKIQAMGCNVVLIMDGFLPPESYVEHITRVSPDLVILGMGMPKQEAISILLSERVQKTMLIVNGGAILDFLANRFSRAPHLLQKLKLEWLFRLVLEPRRLWKRYVLGGFVFLARLLRLKLSGHFA